MLELFERSYAALEGLQCDILLAPHPAFTRVFEKLAAREKGNADAFIEPGACKAYVAAGRDSLKRRVAQEQVAR